MIYKMFDGRHIDLSKILDISPAYFVDRMGSGGFFVAFYVEYQLRDGAIVYEYQAEEFAPAEMKAWHNTRFQDYLERSNQTEVVARAAVAGLQAKVDEIVDAWKGLHK